MERVIITQTNATNNQSTLTYKRDNIFTFGNRFSKCDFKNTSAGVIDFTTGMFVARSLGTYETASVEFNATPLSAGETVILAGLTYTSTAATTKSELADAFANLADGAVTGAGTATGTYGGALTDYTTGANVAGVVLFTATTAGNKTDLAQTGTGAASTITISNGSSAVANGLIPVTSGNLANIIGISFVDDTTLAEDQSVYTHYATSGDIDEGLISFPSGVSMDTIVGAKNLRDVLTDLGFNCNAVTEKSITEV